MVSKGLHTRRRVRESDDIELLPKQISDVGSKHDYEKQDKRHGAPSTLKGLAKRQGKAVLKAFLYLFCSFVVLFACCDGLVHFVRWRRYRNCDCTTVNPGSGVCCERIMWRAHKFGTIMIGDLFREFRHANADFRITHYDIPLASEEYEFAEGTNDYRHAVVTRNWLDAIVSGYLYHKKGHECWIDYLGSDNDDVMGRWEDWYEMLRQDSLYFDTYSAPPANNRSLCAYLVDETEEDGMKVLIDFALSEWYSGAVPYLHRAESKTLFICYEDLVDPFQQEDIFSRVIAFMFPGLDTHRVDVPDSIKASLEEQRHNKSVYAGNHASAHDPALRSRLRGLVEQYDREIFNNTIVSSSVLFGCGHHNEK